MNERLSQQQFYQLQPAIAQALQTIQKATVQSVGEGLVHLIFYRVSQINGCAFCQHMHAAEARRDGERQERLDMLAGWREAPGFTARERAALAWAEALTLLPQAGVTDRLFEEMRSVFDEKELVDLTGVVVTINSWNRIALSNGFMPVLADTGS